MLGITCFLEFAYALCFALKRTHCCGTDFVTNVWNDYDSSSCVENRTHFLLQTEQGRA